MIRSGAAASMVIVLFALASLSLAACGFPGGADAERPTYTVTYSTNGATSGSAPKDSHGYAQGQMVTVLGNAGSLSKTGYSFAAWNTATDGSGASYSPGSTMQMGAANVTLYAAWSSAPTYTVSYNANGTGVTGLVPVDPGTYAQGATVTVLGNSGGLARTGYSFNGWNTKSDENGVAYAPGDTFAMGSTNVTLFAVWTTGVAKPVLSPGAGTYSADQSVTITCATNGATIYYTAAPGTTGTAPTTSSTVYGTPIPVAGDGTIETICAIAVKNGMTSSGIASATIQANFSQYSYNLIVNWGPGGSASGSGRVTHGVPAPISATPDPGHVFKSWSVTEGSGVSFGDPSSANTTATLTSGDALIQAIFGP